MVYRDDSRSFCFSIKKTPLFIPCDVIMLAAESISSAARTNQNFCFPELKMSLVSGSLLCARL